MRYKIVREDKRDSNLEPYSVNDAAERVAHHDKTRTKVEIAKSLRRGEQCEHQAYRQQNAVSIDRKTADAENFWIHCLS